MTPHLGHLLFKIENGHDLDRDDRDYLAGLVRAQVKLPAHRPIGSDPAGSRDIALTALHYQLENECGLEAGVAEAEKVHGVDRRTVYRALKKFRNAPIGFRYSDVAGVVTRLEQTRDGKWHEVRALSATTLGVPTMR